MVNLGLDRTTCKIATSEGKSVFLRIPLSECLKCLICVSCYRTVNGYLGNPDRTCRPSTFWLTRYLRYPALCSPRRAKCVRLGRASSNVVSKWGDSPFCSNVHTPFGPLKENMVMNRRDGQIIMHIKWLSCKQCKCITGVWAFIHDAPCSVSANNLNEGRKQRCCQYWCRLTAWQLQSDFEDTQLIFMHQTRECISWILKHSHNCFISLFPFETEHVKQVSSPSLYKNNKTVKHLLSNAKCRRAVGLGVLADCLG